MRFAQINANISILFQILAAIAVPLNDRKDVFLSYNFEANYNSPFTATDFVPGPLDRVIFSSTKK